MSAAKGNGGAPPPSAASHFPATWVDDAVLDLTVRPIVKGLIEPGAFVLIYGPSQSGKSFFTADLSQHIATGEPWRGRRVQKSLVVYVASEAGASILRRFIAWREHRRPEALERVPLVVLTRGPNLLATVEQTKLCEDLDALQQQAGLTLGWVVFDTVSRSIPGGDENSTEDMTMVVGTADLIRERFNSAVGAVHHTGKDATRGARGHYSLTAAADTILNVTDKVAAVEKVRDGLHGERFAFELEPVELGIDPDGDRVMTCLLNVVGDPGKVNTDHPIGKNQRLVFTPLRALVSDRGELLPGTSAIPKGVKAVKFDDLFAACQPKFTGMPAWRIKARMGEALASLQASGHVGVFNEYIWLP